MGSITYYSYVDVCQGLAPKYLKYSRGYIADACRKARLAQEKLLCLNDGRNGTLLWLWLSTTILSQRSFHIVLFGVLQHIAVFGWM